MKSSPNRVLQNKRKLLSNLERAEEFLSLYPDVWNKAWEDVSNYYPLQNSRSLYEIACPVCGQARELMLKDLYRANGNALRQCHGCQARGVMTPDERKLNVKKATEASHKSEIWKESIRINGLKGNYIRWHKQ